MAGRRKLIVVSNRGPVMFDRDPDGDRVARRGGGGLVTALRSLVEHHDVTWIASAMTDEDREVAEEADGEPIDETARGRRRRTGCASSRTTRRRTTGTTTCREPDAVVRPALPLGARERAGRRPRAPPRLDRGLRRRQPRLRRRGRRGARARARRGGLLPRLPPLRRAGARARARPRRAAGALRPRPVAAARLLARAAGGDPAGAPRGHARERRRQLPHASAGARTSCAAARTSSAPSRTGRRSRSRIGGPRRRLRARPISVDPDEFDELAASEAVLPPRRPIVAGRPEFLILRVDRTDPSKNVVRGFRAFELYLEAHPEMHGRVAMLALLDPSRQDIPEYAEYLGAIQRAARVVNDRFQRDGLAPARPADPGQLPAGGRRLQAVRRAARERDLRRHEPRREGGAARQRARRRAHPLGEHRRARGAGPWALTVNPFDVAGQAEAIHEALTMAAGGAAPRGSRRSAPRSASTTSPAGSRRSSPTSTRRARARPVGARLTTSLRSRLTACKARS